MTTIHPYVTIGGLGTRLKQLSPLDKHLLYFKDKQIVEWILTIVPNCKIVGAKKTNSRKDTLNQITELYNILIIDCDIIPFGFDISQIDVNHDCVFVFTSDKPKWGSVLLENDRIISISENNHISNIKSSGIYFIKDLKYTLSQMTDNNSILSGMIGARAIYEDTFVRLGDVADYVSAIKKVC